MIGFLAQWAGILLVIAVWVSACLKLGEVAEETGSGAASAAGWLVFAGGMAALGWWVWRSFFY